MMGALVILSSGFHMYKDGHVGTLEVVDPTKGRTDELFIQSFTYFCREVKCDLKLKSYVAATPEYWYLGLDFE